MREILFRAKWIHNKEWIEGKVNRMRLIDADELIKRIGKWMPKDSCGKEQTIEEVVATDIVVSVCVEIEETPTAFEKEKVIEELLHPDPIICTFVGKQFTTIDRAIEIVKKGGIE